MGRMVSLGSVSSVGSVDGDLLKVGNPVGHHPLALRGSCKVLAVFRAAKTQSGR